MSFLTYQDLIEQHSALTDLASSGVTAARKSLNLLNKKISEKKRDTLIFEPVFIHQKPGYNFKLVQSLIIQAHIGSDTCATELQKYADWIIAQNRAVQKTNDFHKVPLCNTGTLSHTWDFSAKKRIKNMVELLKKRKDSNA